MIPTNIFYLTAELLEKYLAVYDEGLKTKDYEFHIALHAHAYHEKHLKQEFLIAFETNDKPHPQITEMTVEVLRDIIKNHLKENTDVDFTLAPRISPEDKKIGYPFQLKKFPAGESVTNSEFAAYINKKAGRYRNSELSMIFVPVNKVYTEEKREFDMDELNSLLKIDDNGLHAVYIFQVVNGNAVLRPVWTSSRATFVKAS